MSSRNEDIFLHVNVQHCPRFLSLKIFLDLASILGVGLAQVLTHNLIDVDKFSPELFLFELIVRLEAANSKTWVDPKYIDIAVPQFD